VTGFDKQDVIMIWHPDNKSVLIGKSVKMTASWMESPEVSKGNLVDLSFQEKLRDEK
jgi:hypothetical protein